MTAFGDKGYSGQSLPTDAGLSYVGDQWDGKIASIKVEHGVWRLFSNADYQGDHVDLAPGDYGDANRWKGKIGSFICILGT